MNIVGHTSHTGSEQVNDAPVAAARAVHPPAPRRRGGRARRRTKPTGMGFRQNIVGSGTDDAVDALDRRVEFKITRVDHGGRALAVFPTIATARDSG